MNALRTLLRNLDHFRLRFALIFLVGIGDGIVTFYIPLALSRYTRTGFTPASSLRLTALLAGLFVCSLCLQWLLRRYGELLGPQISFHLRKKYFRAIEALPSQKLSEHHSGYLLSLVGAVSDSLGGLTIEVFWGLAKSLATLVLFFYATAAESTGAAVFNGAMLLIFIFVSSKFARRMIPLTNRAAELRAGLFERYADFMANVLTVKKLGLMKFAAAGIEKATDAAEQGIDSVQRFHAIRWFVLHLLFGLAYIATIASVLQAMVGDQKAVSILILVVGAYAIIRSLIERLSESYRQVIEIGGYIETLDRIVPLAAVNELSRPLPEWRIIKFSQVCFSYPELEPRLQFNDFRIEQGERVFISGPSGAGKTTFLNLLAGFLQPASGARLIDEVDYSAFSENVLRRLFVLLSQETELFNLSIRDNIVLGADIADETIKDHLERLGLGGWISAHTAGLSSIVGEKGIKVSAGQKQRLNLVRGILIGRGLCLLDEPTAHLDQQTEELVVRYLERELAGRTAVIVSHRTELRRLCTRYYRIESGLMMEESR